MTLITWYTFFLHGGIHASSQSQLTSLLWGLLLQPLYTSYDQSWDLIPQQPYTRSPDVFPRFDHVQPVVAVFFPAKQVSIGQSTYPPHPLVNQIMPGRNNAAQSFKPGRPIIDETNYADQPVYAINPVPSRGNSHRGNDGHQQSGNNSRPHASRKGSEAVNLNHLLNFSMPRRDVPGSGHMPRRSKGVRNAAYNKERYVNAQFRFVMKPTANYAAHFADPDLFYQWPQILQVIVPTVSAMSVAQGDEPLSSGINATERKETERQGMTCPICLGQPVAPRMTKCGHIFCYPCILHYFQLSDIPKTAKCPICGDTIQERMLKSVRWADNTVAVPEAAEHHHHDHDHIFGELDLDTASRAASNSSAHKLKMRLVQRPQITTLALPRSPTWPSEAVPATQAPWHFIPDVMSFSKFMLATSDYMLAELHHNLRELEQERILLEGDDLGKSFVDAAIRHVSGQMEKAKSEMDTPALRKAERETREACAELEASHRAKMIAERERKERLEQKDQEEAGPVEAMASAPSTEPSAAAPVDNSAETPIQQPPTPAKSKNRRGNPRVPQIPHDEPSYHYYQAASGANVYLHPLDIKILLAHFKTYNAFPDTITIRPEGADEGTINEDLRRRCKYLAHLQMGTDVVFVEADLEDTLGPEAVAQFEQPLKQRRNRRRDRVKKEDKAKLKWEAQEREKLPFGVRTAVQTPSGDADEDFLLALQRSTVEMGPATSHTGASGSAVGGSEVSSSPTMYDLGTSFPPSSGNTRISSSGISMSVSPPAGAWASSTSAHNKSFASALHAPPGTRSFMPQRNPETDWEIERAWSAFEESARAAATPVDGHGAAGDAVGAAGGKVGKKGKPKKLVLSMSSGGRRA